MITREKFNPTVFRDIVQSVSVGIIAVAHSGVVESWNLAAEGILGWTAEEVTGGPLPLDLPTSASDEIELARNRKNGAPVRLLARILPWRDASGAEPGSLIILTDIT